MATRLFGVGFLARVSPRLERIGYLCAAGEAAADALPAGEVKVVGEGLSHGGEAVAAK